MIERERDDRGIEPRVERVEHALRHRHAVVASSIAGVLASITDTVSPRLMPRFASAEASLPRARVKLGVAAPQRPVDDGGVVGIDGRRALQEAERRQRLEIGRVAVEIDVVGRFRHVVSPLER